MTDDNELFNDEFMNDMLLNLEAYGMEDGLKEPEYEGKKYSLTWCILDEKRVISFCEFYKDTVDFDIFDEIIEKEYHGEKIIDILLKLKDEVIYGY